MNEELLRAVRRLEESQNKTTYAIRALVTPTGFEPVLPP